MIHMRKHTFPIFTWIVLWFTFNLIRFSVEWTCGLSSGVSPPQVLQIINRAAPEYAFKSNVRRWQWWCRIIDKKKTNKSQFTFCVGFWSSSSCSCNDVSSNGGESGRSCSWWCIVSLLIWLVTVVGFSFTGFSTSCTSTLCGKFNSVWDSSCFSKAGNVSSFVWWVVECWCLRCSSATTSVSCITY